LHGNDYRIVEEKYEEAVQGRKLYNTSNNWESGYGTSPRKVHQAILKFSALLFRVYTANEDAQGTAENALGESHDE
jgi:hypothetical protein